ncbi:hypothetical protein GCM10022197_11910 [Microlunatus spumicola]|uniref:Uncharacterized protein n=1 Tax=Microlunatus spumicola TaxID=81499 RepID=A0ABP6X0A3_9ACTN
MSKVDAQRAMREAKYARNNASGPTRREAAAAAGGAEAPTASQPATKPAKARVAKAPVEKAEAAPTEARCGHRSMNGRECTREANHPEKNHRYG